MNLLETYVLQQGRVIELKCASHLLCLAHAEDTQRSNRIGRDTAHGSTCQSTLAIFCIGPGYEKAAEMRQLLRSNCIKEGNLFDLVSETTKPLPSA